MLSPEQKAQRLGRIGSSQISQVLGIDPFRSPYAAWEQITGRDKNKGNIGMNRGSRLESAIVQIFEDENPGLWCQEAGTVIGPENFICDTVDRLVMKGISAIGCLEVKAVGPHMMGHWTAGIPFFVEAQLRWHQLAHDLKDGWIVAFFNLQDIRTFYLERDLEIEALLIEKAREFYLEYIVTDKPPVTKSTSADERERYARSLFKRKTTVKECSAESSESLLMEELRDIAARKKALEERESMLKYELTVAAEGGDIKTPAGSFVRQFRNSVSWAALAKELCPSEELVGRHSHTSEFYTARFTKSPTGE